MNRYVTGTANYDHSLAFGRDGDLSTFASPLGSFWPGTVFTLITLPCD